MKKIIISLTISLCFPILSANAGGKRPKAPCPGAVKAGTEIAQHCAGITVVCPAIAVEGSSQVSARCAGASGITTLCPLYSENPPPGCTYISQRPDEQYLEQPHPISPPGSTDGMSGSTDHVAQPYYPDPTLNLIGPIDPLPDDGRVGGKGSGMGVSPEYCSINKGAKRCTSCSNSNSYSPQYPENTGNHAKEEKKQCTTCSITTERLVPRIGCDSNADCILVRGDCCDGCSTIAINKSQKSKYASLLNNACNPPLKAGELRPSCACGSSHPAPTREAICRATNWKIPSSLTTCQVLEQSSVGGATVGGGTTTGESVQ